MGWRGQGGVCVEVETVPCRPTVREAGERGRPATRVVGGSHHRDIPPLYRCEDGARVSDRGELGTEVPWVPVTPPTGEDLRVGDRRTVQVSPGPHDRVGRPSGVPRRWSRLGVYDPSDSTWESVFPGTHQGESSPKGSKINK